MERMGRVVVALCVLGFVGHAAAESAAPPATAGAQDGTTIRLAKVSFDLPAGWKREQPSSHMRAAQASIPGPGGAAELTVYYFGEGKGGGVDANIERWIGQMELTPGTEPHRDHFETHGLTVTWVDVAGTLKPSGMGMGPQTPQPHSRAFGAVVEGPGGPWFLRATGSDKTLAAQHDNFVAMLKSLRPK